MKPERITLIGGPRDGERVFLATLVTKATSRVWVEEEIYTARRFLSVTIWNEDMSDAEALEASVTIWAHESMSDEDALVELIRGYNPKKS